MEGSRETDGEARTGESKRPVLIPKSCFGFGHCFSQKLIGALSYRNRRRVWQALTEMLGGYRINDATVSYGQQDHPFWCPGYDRALSAIFNRHSFARNGCDGVDMSRSVASSYVEFSILLLRNSLQSMFIGMTRLVDIPK